MKGISARVFVLLKDIIADYQNLRVLCCDIGNALIQPNTKDKIYPFVNLNLVKEPLHL